MELDDLFSEAQSAYADLHPVEAPSLGKYLDPRNWTRTRGVALVHRETKTLLGNYGEFTHNTEAGCRKLVREDPLVHRVSVVEEVSGDWWLSEPLPEVIEPRTRATARLDVVLDGLQLHAPDCHVFVELDDRGHVIGIRLAVHTTFAQIDPEYPQLVFFSAGTELRKEMSRKCKGEVWEILKEQAG